MQHRIKKANHERNWLRATAEAMEVELDSDFASRYAGRRPTLSTLIAWIIHDLIVCSISDEEKSGTSKRKDKAQAAKTAAMKSELKKLLAQPLIARGVSTRYITSGSRPIVDDIIAGDGEPLSCISQIMLLNSVQFVSFHRTCAVHDSMLGLKKVQAGSDIVRTKIKKAVKPKKDAAALTGKHEEWNGFGS